MLLKEYAAGGHLDTAGCVGAGDMTPEAVFTKLSFLIGQGLSPEAVKVAMQADIRGELSESAVWQPTVRVLL